MGFVFFHPYMPGAWEAQHRVGLVGRNSGIRFCQSIDIDEKLKFNSLAREDGILFDYVRETKCPFYIDRLQGGCFFEGYPYDMKLVDAYRRMLGDSFYGFQMHEWMSNVISDMRKLTDNGCDEPWTAENIKETLLRAFPYAHVFTEAMSAEEMAQTGHITDLQTFLTETKRLFLRRQTYTGGMLLPCDSAALACSLELKAGAHRIMPEIGQQTRNTCVQIAYARGMTKAYGKQFGTYYEPWGGNPFSACNFHVEGKNEWNIANETFPFKTAGGNGGSSRSLQRRLFLYSYVAGASFISEEWGLCNTFYDWVDYPLTPYGQLKLDFIRFTEKYADIGEPIVPIAAVIPKEAETLDDIAQTEATYLSYPVYGDFSEKIRHMRAGLRELFAGGETYGDENGCMVNRILPDAVDIVNEDVYDESKYLYAVNLTGNPAFEKTHRCCSISETASLLNRLLPCEVSPGLHSVVSRNKKGEFFLTLMNNTGVSRSVADGENFVREAEKTVSVSVKNGRCLTMEAGNAKIGSENGKYDITVPAGGFFFGRF